MIDENSPTWISGHGADARALEEMADEPTRRVPIEQRVAIEAN
jgi:hypothetical protein